MKNVAVVGCGASGMIAGISAQKVLKNFGKVEIFENMERPGKKLLATGNGRCNLTNTNLNISNYHGSNPSFAEHVLSEIGSYKTIEFFNALGLLLKEEYGGRVFANSMQASSVLEVLLRELESLGVKVNCASKVLKVECCEDGFVPKKFCLTINGENKYFNSVIVAAGGMASSSLGSDGSGYEILKSLGHNILRPIPTLVQLKTVETFPKKLKGVKIFGTVTAAKQGKNVAKTSGEILFTDYGISGTAILDISVKIYKDYKVKLYIDMLPAINIHELQALLQKNKNKYGSLNVQQLLYGLLNKKLSSVIMSMAGIHDLTACVDQVTDSQLDRIVALIKNFELNVKDHNGFMNAQVTAGGADTSSFNSNTMESEIHSGLYATGEVLDVFGDCGGYNLQWAWSSGHIAGKNAGEKLLC